MDAALQASIGLFVGSHDYPAGPPVPFALESVLIIGACTTEMFAWVRHAPGNRQSGKVIKLDVDLCDASGNVCVQMRGFSSRVMGALARRDERVVQGDPLMAAGAAAADLEFDDDFYRRLVERVSRNDVSVDEAVELS